MYDVILTLNDEKSLWRHYDVIITKFIDFD